MILTLFPVSQQEHDGLQQAQGQYSCAPFSQAETWRVQFPNPDSYYLATQSTKRH